MPLVSAVDDRYKAMQILEQLGPQHELRCVVIDGEPPSKARPRFTKRGGTYTPKRTIEGEKRLAAALSNVPVFPGNVALVAIFHRSTRQRIDVDNMLKAVLDAGTRAKIWEDDSQVTALIGLVEHDREQPRTVVAFGRHASTLTRGEDAKVQCEACGTRFFPGGQRRETARWCSRECRTTLAELVPCPTCEKPFRRKNGNHKYCSVECRGLAARRKPLCATCGKPVSRAGYQHCRACWLARGQLELTEGVIDAA